jgi:hypothetical protein
MLAYAHADDGIARAALLCSAQLTLGMGLRERFCVLMYLHAVATRAHAKRDQLTANIGREPPASHVTCVRTVRVERYIFSM